MQALRSLLNLNLNQIAANRANAQRSTGPRTDAGKARSRANATKHGLAGAGVALPPDDAAALAERSAALHDQLRPATPLGSYYVSRIALGTIRAERAAQHEAAALAHRVAQAPAAFDEARHAEVDALVARLHQGDARAAHRALLRTPEGIAALADELLGLWRCLSLPEPLWTHAHGTRLDACLGINPDPLIPSRVAAWTGALLGSFDLLTTSEHEAIEAAEAWALGQLVGLIDRELAALRADDAALDREALACDRQGAAARSLFDPSPAATLARRYEASAVREVDRALRSFLLVEAEVTVEPESTPEPKFEPAPAPPSPAAPNPEAAAPNPAERIEDFVKISSNHNSSRGFGSEVGSFGWEGLSAPPTVDGVEGESSGVSRPGQGRCSATT